MKSLTSRFPVLLTVLLFALCGCFTARREALKKCTFDLDNIKLLRMSTGKARMRVFVGISNPNDSEVVLDKVDFELFIQHTKVADGSQNKWIAIKPAAREVVEVTVDIPLFNLGLGLLGALMSRDGATYRIKGTVRINAGFGSVPFDFDTTKKF